MTTSLNNNQLEKKQVQQYTYLATRKTNIYKQVATNNKQNKEDTIHKYPLRNKPGITKLYHEVVTNNQHNKDGNIHEYRREINNKLTCYQVPISLL